MKKSKQYEINSFKKLCNVINTENASRLSLDLMQFLLWYSETIKSVREKMPEICENKTNWEIAKGKFIWVDDGKNDFL